MRVRETRGRTRCLHTEDPFTVVESPALLASQLRTPSCWQHRLPFGGHTPAQLNPSSSQQVTFSPILGLVGHPSQAVKMI